MGLKPVRLVVCGGATPRGLEACITTVLLTHVLGIMALVHSGGAPGGLWISTTAVPDGCPSFVDPGRGGGAPGGLRMGTTAVPACLPGFVDPGHGGAPGGLTGASLALACILRIVLVHDLRAVHLDVLVHDPRAVLVLVLIAILVLVLIAILVLVLIAILILVLIAVLVLVLVAILILIAVLVLVAILILVAILLVLVFAIFLVFAIVLIFAVLIFAASSFSLSFSSPLLPSFPPSLPWPWPLWAAAVLLTCTWQELGRAGSVEENAGVSR